MTLPITLPPSLINLYRTIAKMLEPDLRKQAAAVYSQLLTQARHPWFYTQAAVPDTLDGRFEMLVLHLFLYLRRLRAEGNYDADFKPLARAIIELMIDDMDQSLRELGVGDMGVSRRIKAMGDGIYGRFNAYEDALEKGVEAVFDALKRNVYGTIRDGAVPDAEAIQLLQAYLAKLQEHLAAQEVGNLCIGALRLSELRMD